MELTLNNSVFFYTVDSTGIGANPTPQNALDMAAQCSVIRGQYQPREWRQPHDPNGSVTIQVKSETAVTLRLYREDGFVMFSAVGVGTPIPGTALAVYNFTVDFSGLASAVNGILELSNGTTVKQSHPLYVPTFFVRINYSNLASHMTYGFYNECLVMTGVWEAKFITRDLVQSRDVWEDAYGSLKTLSHQHFQTRDLELCWGPWYLTETLSYALNHDLVEIEEVDSCDNVVSDWYTLQEIPEVEKFDDRYNVYRTIPKMRINDSFVRRLPALEGTANQSDIPSDFQVTSVGTTTLEVCWNSTADSAQIQLATDPGFATIVQDVTTGGNCHTFTGLTPCVKYYIRIRAQGCAGETDWITLTGRRQTNLHFKGDRTYYSIEFEAKIDSIQIFNILNTASTTSPLIFKYSDLPGPIDKPTWDSIGALATIADLENSIDVGGTPYKVYIEISGYEREYEDAVILLDYVTPSFYVEAGCYDETFNPDDTDMWLGFVPSVKPVVNDVLEVTPETNNIMLGLMSSNTDDPTVYEYNWAIPADRTAFAADLTSITGEGIIKFWGTSYDDLLNAGIISFDIVYP